MNLRDLRYLVALAEHRHFGRAAEASFVSQPTLSTQIKKLEQELGIALIERNPRQILLTDAGALIVERAKEVLADVDDIRRIADRARDPESGTIRLGLFPTLAPYLLPHVVPAVHERFPRVELLLVEEKTDELVARLRGGELDAAVLALPVPDDTLHVEPLFTEDFVLAVPASEPVAKQATPVDHTILANEPVLLLEEGHCLRDQALEVCRSAGAAELGGFRATSLETMRQMVAAGVGITLLPALSVQAPVPQSPEVAVLPIAEPVPHRRIAMLWRPTTIHRELLPKIAEVLRQLPPSLHGIHPA